MSADETLIRVLPVIGCAVVIALALSAALFQGLLYFRSKEKRFHGWGTALSLVTAIFTLTSLIQYSQPSDGWVIISEKIQYCTFPLSVYFLFRFSYSFFNQPFRRLNIYLTTGTLLLLVLVWIPDLVLSNRISIKDIQLTSSYYKEPAPGPLGIPFILICYIVGICTNIIWFKHLRYNKSKCIPYLIGFAIWTVTALHDGLATFGMPTYIYLMSYGVLGFNIAVVWATTEDYLGLKEMLENQNVNLEGLVAQRTAALEQTNRELQQSITELSLTQKELVRSNGFLKEMGNTAKIGGWEIDSQTREIRWTTETYHIYDMAPDETPVYEELVQFFHPTDRPKFTRGLKRALKYGEPFEMELRFTSKTGRNLWTHTICKPSVEEGRTIKLIGTIQDISDRKKVMIERQKLEDQLRQAQKMEAIGTLAGGVAHDLNNVLSGIVTYPEVLLWNLDEASPMRKPLLTIKKSGEKAAEIVNDLLTLARRGVTTKEVIDLNDIVSDYLNSPEFTKLMSYHQNISVKSNLDQNLLYLKGSPIHIRKTIMNLVSNAAEAQSYVGEIAISTYNRNFDSPEKGHNEIRQGDFVTLEISDSGCGISEEEKGKIFEPFYTKKVMGRSGTGLGMSVVWGTVQDHHGFIDIRSKLNEGTTFFLYFPVVREVAEKKKGLVPVSEYMGNGQLVLIVDDIEEQRIIAAGILTALNYKTISASSGEEALDYLKEKKADILLLDMIMESGMDGLETYKKAIAINPTQKAIIASGFAETDRVKEVQRLGARQFIKKPYTIETVGLAIKNELNKGLDIGGGEASKNSS